MNKAVLFLCAALTACGTAPMEPAAHHLLKETKKTGSIPSPVKQSMLISPPTPMRKEAVYSVVVHDVSVQELLFALAKDAKINVDIHPGIQGVVTLNAINQTLPQILSRIEKQVDMRYEMDGPNLSILPDTPYLRNYRVDYLNMTRDTTGTTAVVTQISTTGAGVSTGSMGGGSSSTSTNNSTTTVTDNSKSHFWETLVQNIKDILHETDKILPEGSSETVVERQNLQSTTGTGSPPPKTGAKNATIAASPNPAALQEAGTTVIKRTTFREAASVIANPESGIISVRATSRQHAKIQEFLDSVMQSAKRQVLIEATVVEVQLNNNYQQGINWSRLRLGGSGWNLTQAPSAGGLPSLANQSLFVLNYTNPTSRIGNISGTISLLESFGKVKVLSSPQISVLNNQTAMLKVVDNRIYFTLQGQISQTANVANLSSFTTTVNTVPVGFVMNVTPEISESNSVIINLRPTISRIIGYVNDPNPSLAQFNIINKIPEIQTREMESVIKVQSGQTAVMGGLMQDSQNNVDDTVPGASKLNYIGDLFKHKNDTTTKSELVIFLRPIVIKDPSIDGDYAQYRDAMPDRDFFEQGKKR